MRPRFQHPLLFFLISKRVIKMGFDEKIAAGQRYECKDCGKRFDDLTGTIFAEHHLVELLNTT